MVYKYQTKCQKSHHHHHHVGGLRLMNRQGNIHPSLPVLYCTVPPVLVDGLFIGIVVLIAFRVTQQQQQVLRNNDNEDECWRGERPSDFYRIIPALLSLLSR